MFVFMVFHVFFFMIFDGFPMVFDGFLPLVFLFPPETRPGGGVLRLFPSAARRPPGGVGRLLDERQGFLCFFFFFLCVFFFIVVFSFFLGGGVLCFLEVFRVVFSSLWWCLVACLVDVGYGFSILYAVQYTYSGCLIAFRVTDEDVQRVPESFKATMMTFQGKNLV